MKKIAGRPVGLFEQKKRRNFPKLRPRAPRLLRVCLARPSDSSSLFLFFFTFGTFLEREREKHPPFPLALCSSLASSNGGARGGMDAWLRFGVREVSRRRGYQR